ncbi:hypothetical protein EDB85DRAFT_2224075 [Lactarius pseudohatsudake]|nr:hypothetical protein EDB85DRAFT_2224075 [Lactarius pseudohatsudake]
MSMRGGKGRDEDDWCNDPTAIAIAMTARRRQRRRPRYDDSGDDCDYDDNLEQTMANLQSALTFSLQNKLPCRHHRPCTSASSNKKTPTCSARTANCGRLTAVPIERVPITAVTTTTKVILFMTMGQQWRRSDNDCNDSDNGDSDIGSPPRGTAVATIRQQLQRLGQRHRHWIATTWMARTHHSRRQFSRLHLVSHLVHTGTHSLSMGFTRVRVLVLNFCEVRGSGSGSATSEPEPDLNRTGPRRGSRFGLRARTGPGSGSGFGKKGLRTGPDRTAATLCCTDYFGAPCVSQLTAMALRTVADYLWVIVPKKGMVYWLLESMGYAHKIPAYQLGGWEWVWVTGEYGLSGVWVIRESTVAD